MVTRIVFDIFGCMFFVRCKGSFGYFFNLLLEFRSCYVGLLVYVLTCVSWILVRGHGDFC